MQEDCMIPTISLCNQTTIYNYACPTHKITGSAGKEDDRPTEVLRQAPTTSRCPTDDILRIYRIISINLGHGSLDIPINLSALDSKLIQQEEGVFIPRANTIYIDTLGCPFITHGLCHLQHTSFRASVRSDIDVTNERNDGRNVDYLPGPLQLEQSFPDLLSRHE